MTECKWSLTDKQNALFRKRKNERCEGRKMEGKKRRKEGQKDKTSNVKTHIRL